MNTQITHSMASEAHEYQHQDSSGQIGMKNAMNMNATNIPVSRQDADESQLKHPSTLEKNIKQFEDTEENLPEITIVYRDISVIIKISPDEDKTIFAPLKNFWKYMYSGFTLLSKQFNRITNITGIIKPGTMTLVLSPPGHGKSTFLRSISSRARITCGDQLYNGRTTDEVELEGINVRKLTQYIDQIDTHLPLLTVKETIDFAHRISSPIYDPNRVKQTIKSLGLEECQNTIVGGEHIRGVSGGQRRRVSIGEMLVGVARIIFLDEFSNGLDTATSEDIGRGLRKWVKNTNGSIVATLQQPTPGLVELFDTIILLRESMIVYQGPLKDVLPYLSSMGFNCPHDVDICDFIVDCLSQPRVTIFKQREANDILKKQGKYIEQNEIRSISGEILKKSSAPCVTTESMVQHYKESIYWRDIYNEVEDIFGKDRTQYKEQNPIIKSDNIKNMYKLGYSLPSYNLFLLVLKRQWKLSIRNKGLYIPRIAQAIILGQLYGTLYWRTPNDNYFLRSATFVICIAQCAFGSMIELPITVLSKLTIMKQMVSRFFPPWIYVLSITLATLPISIAQASIMGLLIYFMNGAVLQLKNILIFLLITIIQTLNLSIFFRMLSIISRDESTAQAIAGPFAAIQILFSGQFLSESTIPKPFVWLYWLSPFSWSIRALTNNEFLSSDYDIDVQTSTGTITRGIAFLNALNMRIGHKWIGAAIGFIMLLSIIFILIHIYFLNEPYFELSVGTRRFDEEEIIPEDEIPIAELDEQADNPLRLTILNKKASGEGVEDVPSDKDETKDEFCDDDNGNNDDNNTVNIDNNNNNNNNKEEYNNNIIKVEEEKEKEKETNAKLAKELIRSYSAISNEGTQRTLREEQPFSPAWLSFTDIKYTVQVKRDKNIEEQILQRGISGYAEPTKQVAQMGASGAGKTTLLDVLAGRKTTGIIEGTIKVNGRKQTEEHFNMVSGYIEQFDSQLPYDTVRETLAFAADQRLPNTVSSKTKKAIIDEILDILDLTPIQHLIIGSQQIPSLSPSQQKRVNIGVEQIANPAILFLDEPTTGLDSRSAQIVMYTVRRIAYSGRSVVCTIHQPSAEIFYMFDRLVLLGRGGKQIYYGDLGPRSTYFVKYQQSIPGVKPIPERYNPASWMLEELGVGISDDNDNNNNNNNNKEDVNEMLERFHKYYLQSKIYKNVYKRQKQLDSQEGAELEKEITESITRHKSNAFKVENSTINSTKDDTIKDDINNSKDDINDIEGKKLARAQSYTVSATAAEEIRNQKEINLSEHKKPSQIIQQWRQLLRQLRAYYRNCPQIYSRFGVAIVMAIIHGILFFNLKVDSQASAMSLIGAVTLSSNNGSVTSGATSLSYILQNRLSFYRERSSHFYKGYLSAISFQIVELFYDIILTFIVQIPIYFLINQYKNVRTYFLFFLAQWVQTYIYITLTVFIAAVSVTPMVANVIFTSSLSLQFTFTGITITKPQIPKGYLWQFNAQPLSHITAMTMMPQQETCENLPDCGPEITIIRGEGYVKEHLSRFLQTYLGFEFHSFWKQFGYAWIFVGTFVIQGIIATHYCNHSKR